LRAFSFVHAADLHLGYSQYGLEVRRQDFDRAFQELVDKTIELKPDFMIIAGDLFHQARQSNVTLENAIKNLNRLREARIPVLAVDGSHDSAPNALTGTILNPLDSAGLVCYLPRQKSASWKNDCCYVYGVPNYHTRRKTEEELPQFMKIKPPSPNQDMFNIFTFHMALDLPSVKPPYMEAEAPPELIPEGFNYYAGGHVHKPYRERFRDGLLVYSGCTETTDYADAQIKKGFFHVKVNEKGTPSLVFVKLESPRRFVLIEQEFTGLPASKITEAAVSLVQGADQDGAIIVPVLKGVLPAEANRSDIDVTRIRSAAKKALFVHPLVQLRESEVPEELVRSIFESEFKDLKTKSFEYFLQIFNERYSREQAERIARAAVELIEPLTKKDEDRAKQALEELL
jgi:DNA repair exonuclease SbcCD nuclease subunit